MNLQEAKEKVSEYEHLVGEHIDDREIFGFIIHPKGESIISDIITNILNDIDYEPLLYKYMHFEVLVVYDIDGYLFNGLLLTDSLDNFILKI